MHLFCLLCINSIEFVLTENNEVLLRPVTKKEVDEVSGRLFKAGRPAFDIAEMDVLLKQKIRADFK